MTSSRYRSSPMAFNSGTKRPRRGKRDNVSVRLLRLCHTLNARSILSISIKEITPSKSSTAALDQITSKEDILGTPAEFFVHPRKNVRLLQASATLDVGFPLRGHLKQ